MGSKPDIIAYGTFSIPIVYSPLCYRLGVREDGVVCKALRPWVGKMGLNKDLVFTMQFLRPIAR